MSKGQGVPEIITAPEAAGVKGSYFENSLACMRELFKNLFV
jgi:hypothetical protein